MILKVKKLHENAIIPKYQTAGAACFDLHAFMDEQSSIESGDRITIRTGLAFDIPEGYAMMVYSRSGHGFKHGVRLANCVGIIDSDYRGELMVKLTCDDDSYLRIKSGDRIAQAMMVPVKKWTIEETDDLSETERGANGLGSTGS